MVVAEVKEIISDFILIVYDIPATAKKLRAAFLRDAKAIGAIQHTQSCYLLPLSDKAFELANELAVKGSAVVWKSKQPDKEKALEITTKYGDHIHTRCLAIENRLAISQDYIASGKLGIALRMGVKTGKLLKQLAQIQESYSPDWFKTKLEELVGKWKEIYGGSVGKQS